MHSASTDGFTSIAEILWWLPYLSLALSAWWIVETVSNLKKASLIKTFGDITDPDIQKLLNGAKPPRYDLYALGYGFAAISSIAVIIIFWAI